MSLLRPSRLKVRRPKLRTGISVYPKFLGTPQRRGPAKSLASAEAKLDRMPRKVGNGQKAERHIDPKTGKAFLDSRSYITKGGRYRLFGADYSHLKWAAYQRSIGSHTVGQCECGCGKSAYWFRECGGLKDTGELAHNEHGSRKSDELDRVKWMRHECHVKSHNCGGKPVPSKRTAIWHGEKE
jgi:hypothetical protein